MLNKWNVGDVSRRRRQLSSSAQPEAEQNICVLQNLERGELEERPGAFQLYLSMFHLGQIKEKPWETLGLKLLCPAPAAKTKRSFTWGRLLLLP